MNLTGKRVLIFQQRNWAITIGHPLAKRLQSEGCLLAALTFKPSTDEFIRSQKEVVYEMVESNDNVIEHPEDYNVEPSLDLTEVCRELKIVSIWPIVGALRSFVRSYKDKYYYGFKQNVTDKETIQYILAVYALTKKMFTEFKPDIIIAPNFVSFPHIVFSLYAKAHGVPMFGITDNKVKGSWIFTHSYQDNVGPFWDRIDELDRGADTANRQQAKKYIAEIRTGMQNEIKNPNRIKINKLSFVKKIRHFASPFYQSLRWLMNPNKNYVKRLGITTDYRPPRIIFRDHFCNDRYKKFMDHFSYDAFDTIKKFVYFPLQVQPEASIDVTSPFFNNQIEVARLVAQSLPDDYVLVVKEHPAMVGMRPPSYIEKIARTMNVAFIDYRIPPAYVLSRAALVVSPNSSTIAEAAFLNKHAIQMGDSGTTLKLPNVTKHTDMTTLGEKISQILQVNLRTPEYERRLENFVAAAYDTSFSCDYVRVWEEGDTKQLPKLLDEFISEVKRSMSSTL